VEYRIVIQSTLSPSFREFNPQKIEREAEQYLVDAKSDETQRTQFRLWDKFHNFFEFRKYRIIIQSAPFPKFNPEEMEREAEQCFVDTKMG
jgi:hypothetical protein